MADQYILGDYRKADISSPKFEGAVTALTALTAPTAAPGTITTQIATTAYVLANGSDAAFNGGNLNPDADPLGSFEFRATELDSTNCNGWLIIASFTVVAG